MSSIRIAAARRRTCLLASTFLAPVILLTVSPAKAQQATPPDTLPTVVVGAPVDETRTRAKPITDEQSGSGRVAPSVSSTSKPNAAPTSDAPPVRQFSGIVGASATVITAEDIARSPAQTLPDVLAQVPGIQLQ